MGFSPEAPGGALGCDGGALGGVPGVDLWELRPTARVENQVALGHTASTWQGQAYNPGFLNSSPFKKTIDGVDCSTAREEPSPAGKLPMGQQSNPHVTGN